MSSACAHMHMHMFTSGFVCVYKRNIKVMMRTVPSVWSRKAKTKYDLTSAYPANHLKIIKERVKTRWRERKKLSFRATSSVGLNGQQAAASRVPMTTVFTRTTVRWALTLPVAALLTLGLQPSRTNSADIPSSGLGFEMRRWSDPMQIP